MPGSGSSVNDLRSLKPQAEFSPSTLKQSRELPKPNPRLHNLTRKLGRRKVILDLEPGLILLDAKEERFLLMLQRLNCLVADGITVGDLVDQRDNVWVIHPATLFRVFLKILLDLHSEKSSFQIVRLGNMPGRQFIDLNEDTDSMNSSDNSNHEKNGKKAKRGRPKGARNKKHKPPTKVVALRGDLEDAAYIAGLLAKGRIFSKMGLSDAQILRQALEEYIAARDPQSNKSVNKNNRQAPQRSESTPAAAEPIKSVNKNIQIADQSPDSDKQARKPITWVPGRRPGGEG